MGVAVLRPRFAFERFPFPIFSKRGSSIFLLKRQQETWAHNLRVTVFTTVTDTNGKGLGTIKTSQQRTFKHRESLLFLGFLDCEEAESRLPKGSSRLQLVTRKTYLSLR